MTVTWARKLGPRRPGNDETGGYLTRPADRALVSKLSTCPDESQNNEPAFLEIQPHNTIAQIHP